ARRLRDLEGHAVGAILGEQRVERGLVTGDAGRARGAGLRPRLAAGDQQPERSRGGNQDATHVHSPYRFTVRSARLISRGSGSPSADAWSARLSAFAEATADRRSRGGGRSAERSVPRRSRRGKANGPTNFTGIPHSARCRR